MNSVGVDPAFSDTKTKKTSITRLMQVSEANGLAYLEMKF